MRKSLRVWGITECGNLFGTHFLGLLGKLALSSDYPEAVPWVARGSKQQSAAADATLCYSLSRRSPLPGLTHSSAVIGYRKRERHTQLMMRARFGRVRLSGFRKPAVFARRQGLLSPVCRHCLCLVFGGIAWRASHECRTEARAA